MAASVSSNTDSIYDICLDLGWIADFFFLYGVTKQTYHVTEGFLAPVNHGLGLFKSSPKFAFHLWHCFSSPNFLLYTYSWERHAWLHLFGETTANLRTSEWNGLVSTSHTKEFVTEEGPQGVRMW